MSYLPNLCHLRVTVQSVKVEVLTGLKVMQGVHVPP